MFAVIKTGGKQYRVATDDVLTLEKLDGDAGEMVEFNEVLAVGDGDDVTIGSPRVDGAMVTAEVVTQGRGKKVIAFKKRRRQNSRRKRGHRQYLTTVRISEILTGGAKPSGKPAARKAAAAADAAPAKPEKAEKASPAKAPAKDDKAPAKDDTATSASDAPLFTAPEGEKDKLTEIKGIGPVAERQLNEQGITTFAQIAALSADDIARIDEAMPFSAAQIEDWQAQAKQMAG
ncbi:50S ribosomal protein L21 [Roseitalea porphyridii]|uniref:Large ribosomal subunit protein bL21 n=1 Tax=Roseitalea porphyridii TaxID=1852022 RepID=A0A4P6V506_9HYPH|nr:50S ribosomal protein L21 [Roseitalea porphyridii]QBK32033.1 50S ribosomal protein L21 [Roseitalea porphyridii]